MIVAERKALGDLLGMIAGFDRVLIVGCGTCVTICMAGGEKEVALTASALRLARKSEGRELVTVETTIERQCEWEFIDEIRDLTEECDAVLSLACGAGVQAMAERLEPIPVFPGLDTKFIGIVEEQGVWTERCMGCGDCLLDRTGGICPVARCAKGLMNGPCGGSQDGKCEIDPDTDCAWHMIYERLQVLGRLEALEELEPPKDWSASGHGGPRTVRREDIIL
ncbi:MAG: methylenetetrahydrofolate reductase C-terminal domain-containing protein [Bacillota bacterium]